MRILLLSSLLLFGFNQILASYVPWYISHFPDYRMFNNPDDLEILQNNHFPAYGIDQNSYKPEDIFHENVEDYIDESNIEKEENKSSEETVKVNGESAEIPLSENAPKNIIDVFFNVLKSPDSIDDIIAVNEENVNDNDDDDDKNVDNSNEVQSSEEKDSPDSEQVKENTSVKRNSILDIELSENDINQLSGLLSQISDIEDLVKLLLYHHKYDEADMLIQLLKKYSRMSFLNDIYIKKERREKTTIPTNDSSEDDSNEEFPLRFKNNNDYNNDDNTFSTLSAQKDSEEDDEQTTTTTTDRYFRNELENDLNYIPLEFRSIDDDDSSQNRNNYNNYQILINSEKPLTGTDAPEFYITESDPLTSDDRNLMKEYTNILRDLETQQEALLDDHSLLNSDFATIISSQYGDESVNKLGKDIRTLYANLDKTKGYVNDLQDLHTKIYLRKLITIAIKNIQKKYNNY